MSVPKYEQIECLIHGKHGQVLHHGTIPRTGYTAGFCASPYNVCAHFNMPIENLADVKRDIFSVLNKAPHTLDGVISALEGGQLDGSTYGHDRDTRRRSNNPVCLVGTIARLSSVSELLQNACYFEDALEFMLQITPNVSRPAEIWFTAIGVDNTPDNSTVVCQTLAWLYEYRDKYHAAAMKKWEKRQPDIAKRLAAFRERVKDLKRNPDRSRGQESYYLTTGKVHKFETARF